MFVYLSALNLIDGICTFIGVNLEIVEEYNPLMAGLINKDSWLFLFVKTTLSVFLLFLAVLLNGQTLSNFLRGLTILSIVLYSFISILHIYWLCFI